MAHVGKNFPVAWCRDLSPPWEEWRGYVPKWFNAGTLVFFDRPTGVYATFEDVSDECEYDYESGSVLYRFHVEAPEGHLSLEIDNRLFEGEPQWFYTIFRAYLDSVLIREWEERDRVWEGIDQMGYVIEVWDDDPEEPLYSLVLENSATQWHEAPV